jgi:Zn-dependent protease
MFFYRVRFFSLFGFDVYVDASWLLLAVLIAWSLAVGVFPSVDPGLTSAAYWSMAVVATVGLLFSIVFHEMSHAAVAQVFGMPIRGITLFIFGGVAEMHSEPTSALSEFLMALPDRSRALSSASCSSSCSASSPVRKVRLPSPAFCGI